MITPKPFQQIYIDNVLHLFRSAKSLYDATDTKFDHRRVFAHNAAVLMKAPTGAGKTIMAGTIAESFAAEEKVVWFWFAPFKGLVGQSAMSLRDHHPGLRVRELATDRKAAGTKPGDTFVLTWAAVVSVAADAKKIRRDSESLDSLDGFLTDLRQSGFRIGIVIDEAHHGIGSKTQSMTFLTETLDPQYCLMITATPDDADAENFRKAAGIKELHKVTVQRDEVVLAGLIKPSIHSIAYISPPDQTVMADFEAAALSDAYTTHQSIKQTLVDEGINLVPLMMVQVHTQKDVDTVEEVKRALIKLGFKEDAITAHTANEPDENFLSIAADHTKEVLIFKMAAALGFDAPRAFCMVSMRPIKDTDFGTQLIGRIMRVHSSLQGRKLPPILEHGYLFLADHDSQSGVTDAAEKINKMTSQLAQASPFTMLTKIGESSQIQLVTKGQPQLFPTGWKMPEQEDDKEASETEYPSYTPSNNTAGSQSMLELLGGLSRQENAGENQASEATPKESYVYRLKDGSPLRFRTQELPLEVDDLLICMEQQIGFDNRDLLNALAESTEIIRIEKSHFKNVGEETRTHIKTRIDLEKAEWQAQQVLLRQQYLSAKDLQDHLLKRLAQEFRSIGQHAMADDEERLEAALALILVHNPRLLKDAEKACAARFSTTRDAEPLPGFVESRFPLKPSFKNVYGVFPDDLNPWEVEFAKLLDNDTSGNVLWWHRNPVKKKHSVCIVRPDGGRFFPDFVVGVKGRKEGILLVETKYAIGSLDSQIKAVVEHKDYGKALMIHWRDWADEKRREATTVLYEPETDKNILNAPFRCSALPTY